MKIGHGKKKKNSGVDFNENDRQTINQRKIEFEQIGHQPKNQKYAQTL
jgi:hypothetical protein